MHTEWVAAALGLLGSGCVALTPAPTETVSYGNPSGGVLFRGVEMPNRGDGFVRARPGEETRFGTPRLIAALERAAAEVERRFPGTAAIHVGDLSAPGGGHHPRHGSHRTGRDADLIYYATDLEGRSVAGHGWLAYNRFGYAVHRDDAPEGQPLPSGDLYLLDDARNWCFFRTLLLDEEAAVQWIFVSRGVKSHLLRYAIAVEPDPEVLLRASYVLHEPAGASPHDDHFHVRVLCTVRELAAGCLNMGPVWPWYRATMEKPELPPGHPLDDARLLAILLDPIPE
jgi:penicillin-insensitive murein endopeptidase